MILNLEYGATIKEGKSKEESYSTLTEMYIETAVAIRHEKGLNGTKRRLWGKIQNKIDQAIENKTWEVDFTDEEKDFIKDAYKVALFHPSIAKYVNIFEDDFINKL